MRQSSPSRTNCVVMYPVALKASPFRTPRLPYWLKRCLTERNSVRLPADLPLLELGQLAAVHRRLARSDEGLEIHDVRRADEQALGDEEVVDARVVRPRREADGGEEGREQRVFGVHVANSGWTSMKIR